MSISKYQLRQKATPFSIGTTDLKKSRGSLMDTSGCIALLVTSGYGIATVNFQKRVLRKKCFILLFEDSSFSIDNLSSTFSANFVSLSYGFVEEAIYKPLSTSFWDILDEHAVFYTSDRQWELVVTWWKQVEWINNIENRKCQEEMLKNNIRNLLVAVDMEFTRNSEKVLCAEKSHAWMLLNRFFNLVALHCHEAKDVKYYADKLAITTVYLYKICRGNLELSPKDVINKQVIMEMKSCLANTDMSVKDIASALHFEDISYMCRYFRRLTGVSPMGYRKASR